MAIYEGHDQINEIKDLTTPWEGKSGKDVEDFISRKMQNYDEKTVTNFVFDQADNSTLKGYNSKGDIICQTQVVNATPIYVPELEIVNIRINSNNNDLKTGQSIELNQPSIEKIELGLKFIVKYEILGKYYYAISPQPVKFTLGDQSITVNRVIPNAQADLAAIQYVDITDLFNTGVLNGTLTASCTIGDQYAEVFYGEKNNITVKKIIISYTNKGYVEGTTVSFDIAGLTASEKSSYKLVYLDNGSTIKQSLNLDSHTKIDITNLTPGVHQIYARIEYQSNANLFYSNWIQTNVIVDCKNIQGDAVAVINSVPTEINNCSNALLYKICYAPGTNGGNIVINSYLSENYDDFDDLANTTLTPFNSTSLSLTSNDSAGEREFYSYFELESVGSRDARYIGFTINGNEVFSYVDGGADVAKFFTVAIVENPYNINNAFNHVSGAGLDFSQINGSGSNVFLENNIQLQPGDGWGIDGKYTAFQVSASGNNLFKEAIDLSSYLNNGFTFEFLVRTYNVNGSDPVLRIGNLLIGPGYVRVYHEPDPEKGYTLDSVYVNSKADFQKNAITHILVTYTKEYKPTTYLDTYNQLLNTGTANYQTSSDVTPYNVLKIYINGVINREIQLSEAELKENGRDFKLQICPTTSDIKFYGLRTYGYAFNYEEIKKNRISSLLDANDKKSFYDKNDILNEKGQISLRKCFNKYNVLVYAIPTEDRPLFYGNKDREGDEQSAATLLVHYADPALVNHNGRLWDGEYKAQGSSAKKYLIHNCQYKIKEGKFLTETEIAHNATLTPEDEGYVVPRPYYLMPGSDIKVNKLVGKVNYASSMQSHKQGSCNTYDDVYKATFSTKLSQVFPIGGRKTCLENEFLYFYYNLKPGQDLATITIQDVLDDSRFMGFQTWGSAKADDATYGFNKKTTPEYLLFEGADNGNPGANFKVPWAAFQTYDPTSTSLDTPNQQLGTVTKSSYTAGLLIDDETIKYGKNNDPLDIDYGTDKSPAYAKDTNEVYVFKDSVLNNSLPYFVKFYNDMYQYDFTSFISSNDVGIVGKFDVSQYSDYRNLKIYISSSSIAVENSKDPNDKSVTTAKRWDVFRWDAIRNKWVPAGLHFGNKSEANGGTWETFNLLDEYDKYTERDLYKNFSGSGIDTSVFGKANSVTSDTTLANYVFAAMRYMFEWSCKTYLDVEDVAFHQAMIRVLSGTDNRAKNTYFQIIGKIYEDGVATDKGDYKIRMMQDDLDTIFATDNNGQQNKEYYLLEPAFNKDTEGRWGDGHSSLFYPFDLCFAKQINTYTGNIIHYLLGNSAVENIETNLYKNFLRIQQYFPAIAYNHTAEIYYELAQTIYQGGTATFTSGDFKDLLINYVNNSVKDPLSLSHGSSYEGEVQFLNDRLLLLATLTHQGSGLQTSTQSLVNSGSGESDNLFTVKGNAKYINYFYPNYLTASSNYSLILQNENKGKLNYDSLIDNTNIFKDDLYDKTIIKSLALPTEVYPITLTGPTLTGFAISNTNQYKQLEITEGLKNLVSLPVLTGVADLTIDGVKTDYRITTAEIEVYKYLPVIEELSLTNVQFNNTVLDFRNCNRLRKLDLSGCSNIESIILPEGRRLTEVILPSCIKSISILNNPNLSSITFETGTKLTNLSINSKGVSAQFDINDLIRKYYDVTNAQLLKIVGDATLDLDVVTSISIVGNKASLSGKYLIVDNGEKATISYQLKKDLVKSFGNIDSTDNTAYFEYESLTLSEPVYSEAVYGCKYTEGSDNSYMPFDSLYFNKGNDVVVNSDGTLDITYKLDTAAKNYADIDSLSGEVIVKGNNQGVGYGYTITVRSKTKGLINITGTIYFGYQEPAIGYYAYADGTFSPSVINSKTMIGMVFAKRVNKLDPSKLDLTILGTKTVTGSCSPDYYMYNNQTFNTTYPEGKNQEKVFNVLTQTLYPGASSSTPPLTDVGTYGSVQYSPYYAVADGETIAVPSDKITKDTDVNTYPQRSGKTNTYFYKTVANNHLQILAEEDRRDFLVFMQNNNYMDAAGDVVDLTSEQFEDVCAYFNSRVATFVPSGSSAQGSLVNNNYDQLLYSAFYKACLYEPELKDGESILDGYRKGNWYVPSVDETRILVARRILSTTITTNTTQSAQDWKSDSYNGKGIFTSSNQKYFIGFLKELGTNSTYSYMTSDVAATQGFSIIYGETTNWSDNTKNQRWLGSWSYSSAVGNNYGYLNEHPNCRRDLVYTMPLCCEITVSKE